VGTRQGVAAGEDVVRSGTTAKTDPPGRHTSADFGQGARAQSSSACLAHDRMAGRHGRALSSRFARVRVRVAHRDYWLTEQRAEEWLLIEWPEGENGPTKYWLSTLPDDITFPRLVDTTKLRWRTSSVRTGRDRAESANSGSSSYRRALLAGPS
jgi:hypothetical protein